MASLIGIMGTGLFTVLIIVVGIIGFLIILAIAYYNKFVVAKKNVEKAKSSIEVYYQQRFDLIPNLVDTVKGYVKYEKEMFEKIAELRSEYAKTKDIKVGDELDGKINSVLAIAENYPELKASQNFLELQKALEKVENQLQAARRFYNSEVTHYNTLCTTIPTNIFAGMYGHKELELFKVADAEVKNNVEVKI